METDLQDLPLVRCNAGDLNQVLLNLIVNAIPADVGRGTGQGLAIARTLVVERHGGTLTFEPLPGGTRFEVRIPLAGVKTSAGAVR